MGQQELNSNTIIINLNTQKICCMLSSYRIHGSYQILPVIPIGRRSRLVHKTLNSQETSQKIECDKKNAAGNSRRSKEGRSRVQLITHSSVHTTKDSMYIFFIIFFIKPALSSSLKSHQTDDSSKTHHSF